MVVQTQPGRPAVSVALFAVSLAAGALLAGSARAKPGWYQGPNGTRIVEIDIINKQYVPPSRTRIIPPEYKEQGFRLAIRTGDTIRLCNYDAQFTMKPFTTSNISGPTAFSKPGGLKPGECISRTIVHVGEDVVPYRLFDEIHARNKLFMVVVPVDYPKGQEPTPPSRSRLADPTVEYSLSPQGDIVEGERHPWAGVWKNSEATSVITISGEGSAMTATEKWRNGDRYGANNWSNCTFQDVTATCEWTGDYKGDPAKSGDRHGTLQVTMYDADHLKGSYLEDTPDFKNADGTPFTGYSAMQKGATWPIDLIRTR